MPDYTFRAYMHYDVRPSDFWTTTIEYSLDDVIESGIVEAVALGVSSGLAKMLLTNVVIDRVVVSTWQQDSEPYNPANVRTIPMGFFGQQSFTLTEPVADDLTIFIRKNVTSGLTGKMFLRGAITQLSVDTESGEWTIEGPFVTPFNTRVSEMYGQFTSIAQPALIGAALIDTMYPAVPDGKKQVPIKIYADIPTVRAVSGLTLVGPRTRQVTQ